MIKNCLSATTAVLLLALLDSTTPATANTVIVKSLGSILENSVSLPSTSLPGSGGTFTYYYEFTIPKSEFISASMSISGPEANQIPMNEGSFVLANWTSTGSSSPFIPSGSTVKSETISAPAPGGQGAFLGLLGSLGNGDLEPAGNYFIEIAGTSAGGNFQLAVDGNVTATAPELSTWAMLIIGFAGLGLAGYDKRRKGRLSRAIA